MNTDELLDHAKRLYNQMTEDTYHPGMLAQTLQFLRDFSGEKSGFTQVLVQESQRRPASQMRLRTQAILLGFIQYLGEGLFQNGEMALNPPMEAFEGLLDQADRLLRPSKAHPVAAVILITAILEEFQRCWLKKRGLKLGRRSPTLANSTQLLESAGLITPQEGKDIRDWTQLRDQALTDHDQKIVLEAAKSMLYEAQQYMRQYAFCAGKTTPANGKGSPDFAVSVPESNPEHEDPTPAK